MNKLLTYLVYGVVFGVTICLLSTVVGCVGPEGIQGRDGVAGSSGASVIGQQGPAGVDAQAVIVVPLCPGTSNYGVFVEVALLINNKLYAIYSQNGGFMTYLAPGSYSSNAVGSACSFTVTSDNSISH